jgi:sterol desaturase/sphingolipid hydroxylase (fatty acid hydroxylase superfamily)
LARWRIDGHQYPDTSLIIKAYLVTSFYLLVAAPALMLAYGADAVIKRSGNLFFSKELLPTLPRLLGQIAVCYFCTDVVFYATHRLLHDDRLYKMIHRQHHLFISTVPVAALFAHPIEWLLGNAAAVGAGLWLLNAPFGTCVVWMFVALAGTTMAHSGVRYILWPPALARDATWHWAHHSVAGGPASLGGGIFGHSQLFDTLCRTNRAWIQYLAREEKKSGNVASMSAPRAASVEAEVEPAPVKKKSNSRRKK